MLQDVCFILVLKLNTFLSFLLFVVMRIKPGSVTVMEDIEEKKSNRNLDA